MTGVEILATNEIVTAYAFNWSAYLITVVAITIVMAIVSFITLDHDLPSLIVGLIIGVFFGLILGLIPATHMTPSEYETRYKVIISDEVPMNEFLERYEIISREGKIYTVRERNE